jgi:hypothetical protein
LLPTKILKQNIIQKYYIRDDEMNGGQTKRRLPTLPGCFRNEWWANKKTFAHPTWLSLTTIYFFDSQFFLTQKPNNFR